MSYLIILVALFALMWLLLIRPQRRRQMEQARVQDILEAGDEILTAGGIHGTVRDLDGEIVHVEIAPGTTIRLDRRAVASVAREPEPEEQDETEETEHPASETEKVANPEQTASSDGS